MRIKITALLTVLLLVSCSSKETPGPTTGPTKTSPTPTTTAAPPTATATPATETPTNTPVVEITKVSIPEVDQLEPGTYLVYPKELEDGYALTFIKSDASIKITRSFPLIFEFYSMDASMIQGVSPDGRYYSYLSGYVGDWMDDYDLDGEYDLKLNVVSLQDQSVLAEIPLLSDSFPANFLKYVETHRDQFGPEYEGLTVKSISQGLFTSFQAGIGSFQWAPNGRYLAFAGQMEGLSSDLYVLDVWDRSVRRLTSGPEQIQRMIWSPDSRQIAHASTNDIDIGFVDTTHVAGLDGSVTSFPDSRTIREFGWLNNNQFLAYNAATGSGRNTLTLFDTIDRTARVVWPTSFDNVSYIAMRNLLLLSVPYPITSDLEAGVFFVDPITAEHEKIISGEFWTAESLNREDYIAVLIHPEDGIYLMSNEISIEKISDKSGWFAISPDHAWIAICDNNNDVGLDLYSMEDQTTHSIIKRQVRGMDWLPDSSGFFLEIGESLCLHDLVSGSTIEADESIDYFGFPPYSKFVEIE